MAEWLVRKSALHPAQRGGPMLYGMEMGGWPDPTTKVDACLKFQVRRKRLSPCAPPPAW